MGLFQAVRSAHAAKSVHLRSRATPTSGKRPRRPRSFLHVTGGLWRLCRSWRPLAGPLELDPSCQYFHLLSWNCWESRFPPFAFQPRSMVPSIEARDPSALARAPRPRPRRPMPSWRKMVGWSASKVGMKEKVRQWPGAVFCPCLCAGRRPVCALRDGGDQAERIRVRGAPLAPLCGTEPGPPDLGAAGPRPGAGSGSRDRARRRRRRRGQAAIRAHWCPGCDGDMRTRPCPVRVVSVLRVKGHRASGPGAEGGQAVGPAVRERFWQRNSGRFRVARQCLTGRFAPPGPPRRERRVRLGAPGSPWSSPRTRGC